MIRNVMKIIKTNILESEKHLSNNSDMEEFNYNVDDNDSNSSSSSYNTDNEKNTKKSQKQNSQKRIMKLDHIKEKRLRNHPKVSKIIARNEVQCKCGKTIRLHQAYNPKNLEKHNKTSGYLLTKRIHPLTNYFTNSTKLKQISCIGLRDEEHLKYLQRIGGIIHYGGTPRIEVLAKELFPKKFNKSFSWKRLTNDEKIKLENKLVATAKWRNDFNSNCIQSVKCKIIATNREKICRKCMKLNSSKILRVIIAIINNKLLNLTFTNHI
ncbi:unnamed protein product [Rhizophagus irregularis]|nr:unnamed protein product [Rhizophagus irregularis]